MTNATNERLTKHEKFQRELERIARCLDQGQIKLAATLARVLASDMTKEAKA